MRKKGIIGIILLALIAFAIYFFFNKKDTIKGENSVIKIGVILPLTGDAASYGKSLKTGLDLTQTKKIEYIYEDSKADPKTAVNAINKLISLNKVDAIIGDMFTHTTMAMNPIATQNDILLLTPTASSSKITETGKTTFRLYPSEKEEANKLIDFYNNNFNNEKASIIVVNDAPMLVVADIIKSKLTLPTQINTYSKDTKNFEQILSKLEPDVKNIFVLGYLNESAILIKQAKELGKNVNFLGLSTLYTPEFKKLLGNFTSPIYLTAPYFSIDSKSPIISEFVNKYKVKYGKEPDVWAGYGYDAGRIINAIISKHKDKVLRKDLINEMYNIKDFEGVTGKITINKDRTINKSMQIMKFADNKFNVAE